jgi:hypothetical protein
VGYGSDRRTVRAKTGQESQMENAREGQRTPEVYETPEVYVLGTMLELTGQEPDKCGGTSDVFLPALLTPRFGTPRCD